MYSDHYWNFFETLIYSFLHVYFSRAAVVFCRGKTEKTKWFTFRSAWKTPKLANLLAACVTWVDQMNPVVNGWVWGWGRPAGGGLIPLRHGDIQQLPCNRNVFTATPHFNSVSESWYRCWLIRGAHSFRLASRQGQWHKYKACEIKWLGFIIIINEGTSVTCASRRTLWKSSDHGYFHPSGWK